jgi:hypothetical protein
MKSLLALSAAALLVIPCAVLAQSAGTAGADTMGTGSLTLGTDDDPCRADNDPKAKIGGCDDNHNQFRRRSKGPDLRFH